MNMNLRELYLADNKLNGLQDSAQLGNLLKFNCSLQILDLRNNHVLDSGAPPPAPIPTVAQPHAVGGAGHKCGVPPYCPPRFAVDSGSPEVRPGTNYLPPLGLAYICEGLKEQRKGLVTLVLWNNQLTHTGMAFLGMALVSQGPWSLAPARLFCFV